ncbi:MAG: hypothetical protein RBS99_00480 [Rhodospirillales bacterium]|jgi:hypothetical protein|nr:hypothetical protein [Rhodospirillales bacterium]
MAHWSEMDEFDTLPRSEPASASGQTTALFLSLYVLVLAFFIVLVTISSPEKIKSQAVMDSLTSTFASLLAPSTDLTAFTSNEGDLLAAQAFQEQIAAVFASPIRIAQVEVVQAGRLMRVVMASDSLFIPETAELREAHVPLLDRIVASLSVVTPGLHYDMEFLIGTHPARDGMLPVAETLETARAGAFARAMTARGTPPNSVAVGVRPGDPREIVMRFFVRPLNEVRLEFERTSRHREAAR